jgi:hypothetical protein
MKNVLRVLSGSLLLSLVACGTAPSALNNADLNSSAGVEANAADEGSELGFSSDGCSVSSDKLTFTKAEGGNISISYKFFELSPGDVVKLYKLESGIETEVDAWLSKDGELSAAEGVITIPVQSLANGKYKVKGFVNTLRKNASSTANAPADCSIGGTIVIREK